MRASERERDKEIFRASENVVIINNTSEEGDV